MKTPGLGGLHVLVVDDNEHMRVILQTMLRSLGAQHIREAADGGRAMEMLQTWDADLVIVDYQMKPTGGLELARFIRSPDSPNRSLPIIMLTGHSEASRVAEARDAGVNEFIVKPLSAQMLVRRLQAIISSNRPFVRCDSYFGPDRRRRDDPEYQGPFRREADESRKQGQG
jgi:CheY-like chemotaxis protein